MGQPQQVGKYEAATEYQHLFRNYFRNRFRLSERGGSPLVVAKPGPASNYLESPLPNYSGKAKGGLDGVRGLQSVAALAYRIEVVSARHYLRATCRALAIVVGPPGESGT